MMLTAAQAASQRAAWIKQNLGDGWTEDEPGIYRFDETVPRPEEATAKPRPVTPEKKRPGKISPQPNPA